MAKPTRVYRTELTPVSFLERSAYVLPEKVAVLTLAIANVESAPVRAIVLE